jgi:hypothetical protein
MIWLAPGALAECVEAGPDKGASQKMKGPQGKNPGTERRAVFASDKAAVNRGYATTVRDPKAAFNACSKSLK